MPRPRTLGPELIARAALGVGDRDGPAAMTMRRIAAELGCDPMALYRHFHDRAALLDAVADLALADVPVPPPDAPWEERLRAVLTGIRAGALAHPGIAGHIAARPPLREHGRRLGHAMLTALADAGLPPADVVRASQALVAHLSAAVAMAVQAGARDERWHEVAATVGGLAPDGDASAMPAVGSDEQFAYGLRLLLSGLRAEAAAAAAVGGQAAP